MLKQDLLLTEQEIKGLLTHLNRVDAPPETPLQPQVRPWITQDEFLVACVIAAIVILLLLK